MSVVLLLITHNSVGSSMLDSATAMLGHCPITTVNIPVSPHSKPEQILQQAEYACQQNDDGSGVLILTDMYGSTPSNVAIKLLKQNFTGCKRVVVTGLNLPMLIRVMNYPQLSLDALTEKAVSGGKESIFAEDHYIDCSTKLA